jgi:hypothetical protein
MPENIYFYIKKKCLHMAMDEHSSSTLKKKGRCSSQAGSQPTENTDPFESAPHFSV